MSKLGRNPFESTKKPKTDKPKLPPRVPTGAKIAAGAKPAAQHASTPRPSSHASPARFRLERLAFFRFENREEASPQLALLSIAVRLPKWRVLRDAKNHYEINVLRRPFTVSLFSLRIQPS